MLTLEKSKRALAGAAAILLTAPVLAGGAFDTTAVVAEVNSAKEPIIAVGVAILGVVAVILAFRMIRKITG